MPKVSATIENDPDVSGKFKVTLSLEDTTGVELFSMGTIIIDPNDPNNSYKLTENGETVGERLSGKGSGWYTIEGADNLFEGLHFRITNSNKKANMGFTDSAGNTITAQNATDIVNTVSGLVNNAAAAASLPAGYTNTPPVEFTFSDIRTGGNATDVLKVEVTSGTALAADNPLVGQDLALSVKMTEGSEAGSERYTVTAKVGDKEYILTNDWDGTSANSITVDAETLFANTNEADIKVAEALLGLSFKGSNPINIAETNKAYNAANGVDLFQYAASSEKLNSKVLTVAEGLYGDGTTATEGQVQVRFKDFDLSSLVTNHADAAAIAAGLADPDNPLQIDAIVENQITDGVANGKFTITLRLTNNDGDEILQLGSFSSDELNLDIDGQSVDADGNVAEGISEDGGWVTINNGSPFDGLQVRVSNSNIRENRGYVNDTTDLNETSGGLVAQGMNAEAIESTPEMSEDVKFMTSTAGGAIAQTGGLGQARESGTVAIFNNTLEEGTGKVVTGVSGVTITEEGAQSIMYGNNTDGQGRIYVKFLDDNSFELYKDSSLSKESLVASGRNGEEIKEANNSGLSGFTLDLQGTGLASKTGVYLSLAGIEGQNGVAYSQDVVNAGTNFEGKGMFDADKTLLSGVELGKNTSEDGQLFFKNVYTVNEDTGEATIQVFAYKHKDLKDEDMVAKSTTYTVGNVDEDGNFTPASDADALTVVLNEIRNADNTVGTGLGIVLSVDESAFSGSSFELARGKTTTLNGNLTFTNLGARIFAKDYGSDGMIKVTQDKGAIFTQYGTNGDNSSKRLIDAGSDGVAVEVRGQDATLSVNGMQVKTDGLRLKMATQDIQADLTFNQGKVGSTTLAQVGYGDGSIFTKIGALNLGTSDKITSGDYEGLSGLIANAGHVTSEKINNFSNGMQLQLGEGAGDQNRTVVAIKSMTSENLGRVTKGGYWETGSAVYENKIFTMKDIMGGGQASLKQNATLAMEIIDQAISDVAETRAVIGAFQSNLLQTNSNNLSVTIENITKTESGIRDADMADEMAEFTKQQVLQSAAMSMMGQANQASQNVLQLLR